MTFDRTRLRYALAVLWLLDAALQFQPFMFSHQFATDVLRPSAAGQPAIVAGPVREAADLVAGHPALANTTFAVIQLLIAIGLVFRRTATAAIVASVIWSVAVWWLGEGLGGLLSGHAMLLTGAPGAVILYALLAISARPRPQPDGGDAPINVSLLLGVWAGVWLLGALFQLLPGQNNGALIAAAIRDSADGAPHWLSQFDNAFANRLPTGTPIALALAAVQALIGLGALVQGYARLAALVSGAALATAFWFVGQALGEIVTGQATDPNAAPLIVLLAICLIANYEPAHVSPRLSRRPGPVRTVH
jgi:hypothetical protein